MVTLVTATAGYSSLHHVLETVASANPTAPLLTFVDGPRMTRGELLDEVRRVAGGLAAAGTSPGDRVALMMTNRPEFLVTFLAVSWLGAVSVPINTALRGDVLTHVIESVAPCRLVADHDLLDLVVEAAADGVLLDVWSVGGTNPSAIPYDDLLAADPVATPHRSHESDLASILFTSGTTGPSKGVMWSHRTALTFSDNATWVMGYDSGDVVYTCLPLFHINAMFSAFLPALVAGASVVVSPRFSARRYWAEIAEHGATVTNMLGVMGAILWKQEPSPVERAHRLRLAMVIPFPTETHREFAERFGTRITELYGSTDTAIPLGAPHGTTRPGSCGVAAPGWEVALVDEHDRPVPRGRDGELVTRPTTPFVGQLGYWRLPDKTWEAHRNAWFHTGDQLSQDEDGWFYFRDRLKDSLRVSGENVSSYEVEQVLLSHPAVAEVAVFAVPNPLGDDFVMAAVVESEPGSVRPSGLIADIAGRLPYFAVPRFVDVVDELPKTSTQKVRKEVLRARGVSPATWDGGPRSRSRT
jgi:crotonobetaine/carnitine-CoA ligase